MKTDNVVRVLSVLRALTDESVVDSFGARSRTPLLGPLGFFGVGLLFGAGVGMLATPVTGKQARAYAKTVVDELKTKLEKAEESVLAELKERAEQGDEETNGTVKTAGRRAAARGA